MTCAQSKRARAAATLFALLVALPVAARPVSIGGTGAGVAIVERLAEAYAVKGAFEYRAIATLGSTGGINAFLAGAIDIAVSARPLTDAERARGASAQEFARTALVIAVHPSVPVSAVSRAELADLYGGKTRTWIDGAPVRLILRPPGDTDTKLLAQLAPPLEAALAASRTRPGLHQAVTDQEATDALEHTRGSVGVTSLALIRLEKRNLKVLRLDGVTASTQTIADDSYPLLKSLYIVADPGNRPAVRDFLAFLRSAQAASLLARLGAVPVPSKTAG